MSDLTLERGRQLRAKLPAPPWFVGFDDAEECGPHRKSGLAKVDTGRSSDWPIARLCEWPTAEWIAASVQLYDLMAAEIERLNAEIAKAKAQSLPDREERE